MSTIFRWSLSVIFILLQLSCADKNDNDLEEEEQEKTCEIDIDTIDFTFGMDYGDPDQYLTPGEQSDLNKEHLNEVIKAIGIPDSTLEGVLTICQWVNMNFSFEDAGGGMIGVPTADELFETRTFYGCHSQALIISSLLRKLEFPAIMIETASVPWGYRYKQGDQGSFGGHVMSEIYVEGSWILLDNNGQYVQDYDCLNPFISTSDEFNGDLFVLAKGLDTWDYFSKAGLETHDLMINFAENIYCFEELFDSVIYEWQN